MQPPPCHDAFCHSSVLPPNNHSLVPPPNKHSSLLLPLTFDVNLTPIDCHHFTPLLSAFLQITHQHIHAAHPNPLCQQCLPNQLLTLLHSFVLCIPPNHPAAEPCCTSKSPLPTMPAKAPSDFSFHTFNTPLQTLQLHNSHTHTRNN